MAFLRRLLVLVLAVLGILVVAILLFLVVVVFLVAGQVFLFCFCCLRDYSDYSKIFVFCRLL